MADCVALGDWGQAVMLSSARTRVTVLATAYAAHPERFPAGCPIHRYLLRRCGSIRPHVQLSCPCCSLSFTSPRPGPSGAAEESAVRTSRRAVARRTYAIVPAAERHRPMELVLSRDLVLYSKD